MVNAKRVEYFCEKRTKSDNSAATLAEGECHSCIHSEARAAGTHSVRKNKPSHGSELGDSLRSDRYALLIKPLRAALFISFFIHFIFAPTKWLSF